MDFIRSECFPSQSDELNLARPFKAGKGSRIWALHPRLYAVTRFAGWWSLNRGVISLLQLKVF
jgi:hypothetical protein